MKKIDRVSGIVLVIFSIVGFIYAKATSTPSTVGLASNTYPQFLFICLAICGVILVITSLSKKGDDQKADFKVNWRGWLPVVGVLLIYILVFDHVHFIISSVIFLALEMFLFGERRWKVIVPISILAPVIIFFLFTEAFSIILPS